MRKNSRLEYSLNKIAGSNYINNNANATAYYNNTSETNNNTRDIFTPQVMKDLFFQTHCTMKFQMLTGSREGCHSTVTKRQICDP